MILPQTDFGERPAGKPGVCFYCGAPVKGPHQPTCVTLTKSVVVRMSLEYVVSVPRHWDQERIEFHRNEGSWCGDNDLHRLSQWAEADGRCICFNAKFAFVREATAEDHASRLPDLTQLEDA